MFTIRKNTERPITILKGTNKLVKIKEILLLKTIKKKTKFKCGWKNSFRILKILKKFNI